MVAFLRLNGMSAREHPVYRELERVKQYFQKAKLAEVTLQKPVMRLDQGAAGRFIKAALVCDNMLSAVDSILTNDSLAMKLYQQGITVLLGMDPQRRSRI